MGPYKGSRVVRRLQDTEEEASEQKTGEIFGERSSKRDDGPAHHDAA